MISILRKESGMSSIVVVFVAASMVGIFTLSMMLLTEVQSNALYQSQTAKMADDANQASIEMVAKLLSSPNYTFYPELWWQPGVAVPTQLVWQNAGGANGPNWTFSTNGPINWAHHGQEWVATTPNGGTPASVQVAYCSPRPFQRAPGATLQQIFTGSDPNPQAACNNYYQGLLPDVKFMSTSIDLSAGKFTADLQASTFLYPRQNANPVTGLQGYPARARVSLPPPRAICTITGPATQRGETPLTLNIRTTMGVAAARFSSSDGEFNNVPITAVPGGTLYGGSVTFTPLPAANYPVQYFYTVTVSGIPHGPPASPYDTYTCQMSITLSSPCKWLDPTYAEVRDAGEGPNPLGLGSDAYSIAHGLAPDNRRQCSDEDGYWHGYMKTDPAAINAFAAAVGATVPPGAYILSSVLATGGCCTKPSCVAAGICIGDCSGLAVFVLNPNHANCDLTGPISTRDWSCFPPETKIRLIDGSEKNANEIASSDVIYNPITHGGMKVVKVIAGPEKLPLFELGYEKVRLKVTETHPILTLTGVKQAKQLVASDAVMGADGKFHSLSVLHRLPVKKKQIVYNFEFNTRRSPSQDDHMILADGIVAGDYTLQNILIGKPATIDKVLGSYERNRMIPISAIDVPAQDR